MYWYQERPSEIRLAVAIAKRRHCQVANLMACMAVEPQCDLSAAPQEERPIKAPEEIKRHWIADRMSWDTGFSIVYEPTGERKLTQVGIRIIRKRGGKAVVHRVMSEQVNGRQAVKRWGTHGPRLRDIETAIEVSRFIASHKPVKARAGKSAAQIAGYQRQRERLVAEARARQVSSQRAA